MVFDFFLFLKVARPRLRCLSAFPNFRVSLEEMSKPEELVKMPAIKPTSTEALKPYREPATEPKIGPQRRKRMPAGRHLDAIKTVPEQPKLPTKITEQFNTHLKDLEQAKSQSLVAEQTKTKVQGG